MSIKFLQWKLDQSVKVFTKMVQKMEKISQSIGLQISKKHDAIQAIEQEINSLNSMKSSNDKMLQNFKKLVD